MNKVIEVDNKDTAVDNKDYLQINIDTTITLQQKLLDRYLEELAQMPEGTVSQKSINGKKYYFRCFKKGSQYCQEYIKKSDLELASQLICKQYLTKSIKLLQADIETLKRATKEYKPFFAKDVIGRMVFGDEIDTFQDKKMMIKEWANSPFEKCTLYPENRIHTSYLGLKLRSKSEALIAGILELNQVSFQYEAKLQLGENEYFPDFTLMRPKDGKIIYWEHFGMTQSDSYFESMMRKYFNYLRNGIIPWQNFIMTFDNEEGAMDASLIQDILNAFILS